jgi:hypothetical protein
VKEKLWQLPLRTAKIIVNLQISRPIPTKKKSFERKTNASKKKKGNSIKSSQIYSLGISSTNKFKNFLLVMPRYN